MLYLWLALGGALGTIGRYMVADWVVNRFGPSPLGTFTVNIVGSFLIGFFLVFAEDRLFISSDVRRFVAIGCLGGFTTFSSFMFETMGLLETGSFPAALLNIGGSLLTGLVAVWLGMLLARML